jgi:hypothetical protein
MEMLSDERQVEQVDKRALKVNGDRLLLGCQRDVKVSCHLDSLIGLHYLACRRRNRHSMGTCVHFGPVDC